MRKHLVEEGLRHLDNVVLHSSGPYIISQATFPSYFQKDEDEVSRSHALLDVTIFGKIAAQLGITRRYIGEEPFSRVTNLYNQVRKPYAGPGRSPIIDASSRGGRNMLQGIQVELPAMLDWREGRAFLQRELREEHHAPLISFRAC